MSWRQKLSKTQLVWGMFLICRNFYNIFYNLKFFCCLFAYYMLIMYVWLPTRCESYKMPWNFMYFFGGMHTWNAVFPQATAIYIVWLLKGIFSEFVKSINIFSADYIIIRMAGNVLTSVVFNYIVKVSSLDTKQRHYIAYLIVSKGICFESCQFL